MTPIQFGFIMPAENQSPAARATFVADLNRALELISGHFESARLIDHLEGGDLESFTTLAYIWQRCILGSSLATRWSVSPFATRRWLPEWQQPYST